MTEYDRSFNLAAAFGPEDLKNTLAEVFAREKIRNIRIAETEKYAHVTYFLNGGVEKPFPFEERALIPSAKVATYDLEPTMRAKDIAERAKIAERSQRRATSMSSSSTLRIPTWSEHTGVMDADGLICQSRRPTWRSASSSMRSRSAAASRS